MACLSRMRGDGRCAGPLLLSHSCLSMPSLPAHLCSFFAQYLLVAHLFFLGEHILPVLLTSLWPGEQPEASFVILAV